LAYIKRQIELHDGNCFINKPDWGWRDLALREGFPMKGDNIGLDC